MNRRGQIRDYFAAADLDAAERSGALLDARLPLPLPHAVRRVATAQLLVNALLVSTVAVALAIVAVAVIIMPLALGRKGVGMAIVSMFGLCVSALLSTIPFFAARGAARILRRDSRGVAPVMRVAWLAILFAVPVGFAGALALNYARVSTFNDTVSLQSMVFLAAIIAYALLALWTIVVLKKYRRSLPWETAPVINVQ